MTVTTKGKQCEHLELKYCKKCVYYICKKCGALTDTMKPLKFWTDAK